MYPLLVPIDDHKQTALSWLPLIGKCKSPDHFEKSQSIQYILEIIRRQARSSSVSTHSFAFTRSLMFSVKTTIDYPKENTAPIPSK